MNFQELQKKETWKVIWSKHMSNYIHSKPRHGFVIEHIANKYDIKFKSCLETGCGSARDSRYLSVKGYTTYCIDFSLNSFKIVRDIAKKYNLVNSYYIQGNVFNLPLKDKSIDISFHSGLLIYFQNNKQIYRILEEQRRVTKKLMIIFVHNKFDLYNRLACTWLFHIKGDKLYNFRWYSRKEIEEICKNYGRILDSRAYHYSSPLSWKRLSRILGINAPKVIKDMKKQNVIVKAFGVPMEWAITLDVRKYNEKSFDAYT